MASRKQHFNLLLIVGLSLYSLPVVGSEFSYGDFDSQDVVETKKAFSEIISENRVVLIAPTMACLLGGLMFKNRHKVPSAQVLIKQVNRFHEETELKALHKL